MANIENETPIKQCITVLDKKVRNLEKRKVKLDALRDKASSGDTLDKDQQDAVSKYEVVIQNLDFSRELQKQFQQISNDADKQIKKQCKREKLERQQQEMLRLQVVLKMQSILDSLGTERIRNDFLTGTGTKIVLSQDDLNRFDEFYQAIVPSRDNEINFQDQLASAAEHISLFLDASDKTILIPSKTETDDVKSDTTMTYERLNQLIESISKSGYFENGVSPVEDVVAESKPANEALAVETHLREEEESFDADEPEVQQWDQAPSYTQNGGCDYQESAEVYDSSLYNNQANVYANQASVYASDVYTSQAAVYTNAYRQRPLQEIVSSMQGNYNFLQDSEIDVDGNHVKQTTANANIYESTNSAFLTQQQMNTYSGGVGAQNLPVSSYTTGVGVQNMPINELQYLQEGHRSYAGSPAYVKTVVGPPPIPLPNEEDVVDENLFVSKDTITRHSDTQAKAPNVLIYHEEEKNVVAGKQGGGDIGPRTFAQTAGGPIHNYGGMNRNSQPTSVRPNVAASGSNKNMHNSARGQRNNGDDRVYAGSSHSNQRATNNRGQEQPSSRGYGRTNQMQATA